VCQVGESNLVSLEQWGLGAVLKYMQEDIIQAVHAIKEGVKEVHKGVQEFEHDVSSTKTKEVQKDAASRTQRYQGCYERL
jgi:hypothetical protein